MANALYSFGGQNILEGDIIFDTDDIRIVSLDEADHTVNLVTDEDIADLAATSDEFASGAFASKTETLGVFDAADLAPAFTGATGDVFESIIVYKHTGVDTTALLVCNIDTATGLPMTPDGGNINVTWSASADRIFAII
jgi:hypothetical protein